LLNCPVRIMQKSCITNSNIINFHLLPKYFLCKIITKILLLIQYFSKFLFTIY
jgi:hypothetical protein